VSGGLAIVTGAAAGTGLALARRLAADGAQVVLTDVDDEAGRAAAAGIEGARYAHADMTERGDVERLLADPDGLRVLVNNAGGWIGDAQFPDAPFEDWSRALDLNLRGPMLATQLAIAPMRSAGGGVVVNVASSAATRTRRTPRPSTARPRRG
jgi:NAD(P)-dependent dehydrogenase (short-subunit alcohol dehydrogenase family)